MAEIKTTHTMDRYSPTGKYVYEAAQESGKFIEHFRTNAFVDVKMSSAYITQYASHGFKIDRPCIEISGEIHGVSGIFADKKRNLSFAENERPMIKIGYELSDDEMTRLIDNGMYRRDNYAKLFSDILEGKSIDFEAPVEYLSIDFEDDDKQVIILDTVPMSYQALNADKVDFPFDEPFEIIDEIQSKETDRTNEKLESVEEFEQNERRDAFFERISAQAAQTEQEDELADEEDVYDDDYGYDEESSISGERLEDKPMFDDVLNDNEPLFDTDKKDFTEDYEEAPKLESIDIKDINKKKDEKTIYEKDDDLELLESVDSELGGLDDFEW